MVKVLCFTIGRRFFDIRAGPLARRSRGMHAEALNMRPGSFISASCLSLLLTVACVAQRPESPSRTQEPAPPPQTQVAATPSQAEEPTPPSRPEEAAPTPETQETALSQAQEAASPSQDQEAVSPLQAQGRALPTNAATRTGDFDVMLENRVIRVLAPYSRTFFFNDMGRERGYAADLVRVFEKYLNQKLAPELGKRPLTVIIIPATREKLLQEVVNGTGDIAVGNLTVTEARKAIVDFVVAPDAILLSEVVLTGPNSPVIATTDDLSGKTVHVRASSSYYESLTELNGRFNGAGKPPVNIVVVPDALEDEDMMEMLNLGLFQAIVVDDVVANMWAPILPNVKINKGAAIRTGAVSGWAIRKDSPKLKAEILEAYVNAVQNTPRTLSSRVRYYSGRIRKLQDPSASEDYQRFVSTVALFRKYGEQYNFDPLMLAAQSYQESQLNQEARSPVGAIGLMQLMPATGADLGVGDITLPEENVHAGAKYMDQLMTKFFPDAKFDDVNRSLFAFAAYNCGPGNMAKLRREAGKRGLDPNVWFNNVEVVTAEKIGIETTTYVRNIFKYYVSYRLMADIRQAQKTAREAVK
jgi:membrane-bound lytic murein transglycosylase MltF